MFVTRFMRSSNLTTAVKGRWLPFRIYRVSSCHCCIRLDNITLSPCDFCINFTTFFILYPSTLSQLSKSLNNYANIMHITSLYVDVRGVSIKLFIYHPKPVFMFIFILLLVFRCKLCKLSYFGELLFC